MYRSESGLGIRGSGLAKLLGFGFFLTLSPLGFAENPANVAGEPHLKMTVRVYDYAQVPRGILDRAESEATAIFRAVGVETNWLDCPRTNAEIAQYRACQGDLGPADFIVNLLPRAMASQAGFGDSTFGFSRLSAEGKFSFLAGIFYDRIEKAVRGGDVCGYHLLAHAVAHEIAHLVFGTIGHSQTGLMAARWDHRDLERMGRETLQFTSEQSERLQAELRRRVS